MKKYIILAASALCMAAVSNAQATQKQSSANSVHTVAMTKSVHSPATVSSGTKTNSRQQTLIKRKHHKKTVHPKKMVDKK